MADLTHADLPARPGPLDLDRVQTLLEADAPGSDDIILHCGDVLLSRSE